MSDLRGLSLACLNGLEVLASMSPLASDRSVSLRSHHLHSRWQEGYRECKVCFGDRKLAVCISWMDAACEASFARTTTASFFLYGYPVPFPLCTGYQGDGRAYRIVGQSRVWDRQMDYSAKKFIACHSRLFLREFLKFCHCQ